MAGIFFYYIYLIFFWGLVRKFIVFPEVVEELWLKPVIWLVPLMLWNLMSKKRVVIMRGEGVVASVVVGTLVGLLYVFIVNGFGYKGFVFDINYAGIALSIAMTEEIVFSGIIYGYLARFMKNPLSNLIIVSLMATGAHVPMMYFRYSLDFWSMLPSLLFVFGYSLVNVSIRAGTGNVVGSVIARFFVLLSVL